MSGQKVNGSGESERKQCAECSVALTGRVVLGDKSQGTRIRKPD